MSSLRSALSNCFKNDNIYRTLVVQLPFSYILTVSMSDEHKKYEALREPSANVHQHAAGALCR